MLSKSSAPVSYCKHTTDFVDQFVNKNVIGVVDIHGYVSMSMSVNSLVDTVCGYVIVSMTGNKGANCKNTSDFLVFLLESHSKKRIASIINIICLCN